jgi:hypothetical protein
MKFSYDSTACCSGFAVIEKYNYQWNLELLNVYPKRQKCGTIMLNHIKNIIYISLIF